MDRRPFLSLAAAATAGLAGCTASALPSPDPGDDGESDPDCPRVLDVDRTVCPADGDAPLAVDRSSAAVAGEDWSLVVTVANRSAEPVSLNPHAWSVYRRAGDRWAPVAPDAHVEPWLELAPDDRYAWQLTDGESDDGADQQVVLDLSPGTYAFAVPLQGGQRLGAVATFDVAG